MNSASRTRALRRRALAATFTVAAMMATVMAGAANARSPMVVAHRGGAMLRPENTIPAFRHAAELGVDVLEFDMEMTADDRIVIHHDGDINPDFCVPDTGSAVVPGPVRGLSFADIGQFDCGTRARPSYAGEAFVAVPGARIPSLDDVLSAFSGSKAHFFAETKIPKEADVDPVKFATLLDAAVRQYGLEDRLILQSFDFRTIDALHAINPRIRTCLLGAQKLTRDYLALLRQHHATCIVLGHADIDAHGVRELQGAGIIVYSGVGDTPDEWRKYLDLGVDAIFTNEPERLIGFLRQSGLRR